MKFLFTIIMIWLRDFAYINTTHKSIRAILESHEFKSQQMPSYSTLAQGLRLLSTTTPVPIT